MPHSPSDLGHHFSATILIAIIQSRVITGIPIPVLVITYQYEHYLLLAVTQVLIRLLLKAILLEQSCHVLSCAVNVVAIEAQCARS